MRRRKVKERVILPDPKYNNVTVTKFVNNIMLKGKKNIAFVLEFLRNESIRIISRDLAGHASRRLFFLTDTGEVFLKRIQSRYYPNMRLHEKAMLKQVRKEAEKPAKVSFFLRSVK